MLKRTYSDYKVGIKDNCLIEIITKHNTENIQPSICKFKIHCGSKSIRIKTGYESHQENFCIYFVLTKYLARYEYQNFILNEIFAKYQLTDISMDIIKKTHINLEWLQTLGELDTIADQISKHQSYYLDRKIHVLPAINRIHSPWL